MEKREGAKNSHHPGQGGGEGLSILPMILCKTFILVPETAFEKCCGSVCRGVFLDLKMTAKLSTPPCLTLPSPICSCQQSGFCRTSSASLRMWFIAMTRTRWADGEHSLRYSILILIRLVGRLISRSATLTWSP